MKAMVHLQVGAAVPSLPNATHFKHWVETVFASTCPKQRELTIRVVNSNESQALNEQYRHKKGPTNVLSFPNDPTPGMDEADLGDIALCAPLVEQEASEQGKLPEAHWAHLTIHGVLHLLGYDHVKKGEAEKMERLEITLLNQLGFPNPYQ